MIIKEIICMEDGTELVRHYSDSNKYIIQVETGDKYSEAVDLPNRYTYIESEEELESTEEQSDDLEINEL